ncbi:PREDICTED: uncharacterized protein LOC109586846 [Amphimedon queenslandica]|uniref:Uncharacterized protein n=2 Tax=Amphimedon queenslandica TaxID=400682 RepID=A0AAN0JP77_AMPQE|nr:PREDICTED: uncharacterized protein LOC109586846 [Amphimedon queenslandica]|eukprot:XP_019858634.1 PREDICTED: uncharacterized protein LOC109586846 [Amphimedon queenslandica]
METEDYERICILTLYLILTSFVPSFYFLTSSNDNHRKYAEIAVIISTAAVLPITGYIIKFRDHLKMQDLILDNLGNVVCYISIFVVTYVFMVIQKELSGQNPRGKFDIKTMSLSIFICTVICTQMIAMGTFQYLVFSIAFFIILYHTVDKLWKLWLVELVGVAALLLGGINHRVVLWFQDSFIPIQEVVDALRYVRANIASEITLILYTFAALAYFLRHFWKPSDHINNNKKDKLILLIQFIAVMFQLYSAYDILFEVLCLYSIQAHIHKKGVINIFRIGLNVTMLLMCWFPHDFQLRHDYLHVLIPIAGTILEFVENNYMYSLAMGSLLSFFIFPTVSSMHPVLSLYLQYYLTVIYSFVHIPLLFGGITTCVCSFVVSLVIHYYYIYYPISDLEINSIICNLSLFVALTAIVGIIYHTYMLCKGASRDGNLHDNTPNDSTSQSKKQT